MKAVAARARIVLVTATLGERGKTGDPPVCAPQDVAACRQRELRDAARIIGFEEVHLLGYRDQELVNAATDEIRRKLVTILREEKPAVVFTFDPDGFNRHPDHIAISRFTSDAIAAAADPRCIPKRAKCTPCAACSGRRPSRPGMSRTTSRWPGAPARTLWSMCPPIATAAPPRSARTGRSI